MRLPNINYQWNAKELAKEDSSQPVRLAQQQAGNLQSQAGTDAAWASAANANSNTARAWGKLYEQAGAIPDEWASIATKYDSSRADAKITSTMTDFSTKYDRKDKGFFTPEELTADGIDFVATEKDVNGNTVTKTEIPKFEIYQQAYEKYARDAKTNAQNEFGWLSYDQQWEQKTDTTMALGAAEASQKAGAMAQDYLVKTQDSEVEAYMSQGKFGAALKVMEGCIEGQRVCGAKVLKVLITKDMTAAEQSMVSGDVNAMKRQRSLIADGNTRIPMKQSLGLINKLNKAIDDKEDENDREYYSNKVNKQLNEMDGMAWEDQKAYGRKITDAKERAVFTSQLANRISMDKTVTKQEAQDLFDETTKGVQEGKITEVPSNMQNAQHRQNIAALLKSKAEGKKFITNPVVSGELEAMYADPTRIAEVANLDKAKYLKLLNSSAYEKLSKNISKAQQGIPLSTAGENTGKRIQQRLLRGESVPKKDSAAEKYYTSYNSIMNQIQQMRDDGKVVSPQMEDEIISQHMRDYKSTDTTMFGLVNYSTNASPMDIEPVRHEAYDKELINLGYTIDSSLKVMLDKADVEPEYIGAVMAGLRKLRKKNMTTEDVRTVYKKVTD